MTQAQNQDFNLDNLLEGTLDDLADFPEFRPYPAGTHRVNFSFEWDKKDKTILFGKMKLLETLEQTDAEEKPLEVGAEASVRYDLSNVYAQGNLKKILASAAAHFGAKKNSELITDMQNVECLAVTKLVTSKKNTEQKYVDIVELQVV
jgi:hypothetical protein